MAIEYAVTPDGVHLACCEWGRGNPMIVIPILNATGEDVRNFSLFHGPFRTISFDRRGMGSSTRGHLITLETLASDILAVADHFGLERFALGSALSESFEAVTLAVQRPDRVERLVLADPCPSGAAWLLRPNVAGFTAAIQADWDFGVRAWAQLMTGWGNPDGAEVGDELLRRFDRESFQQIFATYIAADMTTLYPRITVPTLVVRDIPMRAPASWAEGAARAIPNARLVISSGPGPIQYDEAALATHHAFIAGPLGSSGTHDGAFRTILFTDLEGHTAMMSRLGDAKGREVLREHERITREALAAHGGTEVKTMGDGFMASFGSAQKALDCAIQLQRSLQGLGAQNSGLSPLRVRVGVNAGEPIAEDDDLFGSSVIAAARIASKAQGGQVLVANVVRELVAGKGFLFHDTGAHDLKGLEEPVRLWELRWEER